MAGRTTPSFVLELPVRTTAADQRVLAIGLDAALNIDNVWLGELLRRLDLRGESRARQMARRRRKRPPGREQRKARATAFRDIRAAHGFTLGARLRRPEARIPAG
jgi:hypothetical protein